DPAGRAERHDRHDRRIGALGDPARAQSRAGGLAHAPLPHRGRGWPPRQRRPGEGACDQRPSPSHRFAMGPSLSRNAGEGLQLKLTVPSSVMWQFPLLATVIVLGTGLIACLGTPALMPLLRPRAVL